jgi:type IV secretory pathway VirD2 relaxase
MNEVEKLRVLIPHWIEHNAEHAEEFRRWANQVGEAAKEVAIAADLMVQVNAALETALEKLGGALDYHNHHHHHHD